MERERKLGSDCLPLIRSGEEVFRDKDAKHESREERRGKKIKQRRVRLYSDDGEGERCSK